MVQNPIPADDILRIVPAADGSVVVAVYDGTTHSLDIYCNACGNPYTLLLSRGCTEDAKAQFRTATAAGAEKHAKTRHTPRVVDSAGGTSS